MNAPLRSEAVPMQMIEAGKPSISEMFASQRSTALRWRTSTAAERIERVPVRPAAGEAPLEAQAVAGHGEAHRDEHFGEVRILRDRLKASFKPFSPSPASKVV